VGLLAGLDALLVALALLVAMLAVAQVFRPLLVNVLSQAPFIGGWLAGNVDAGLARFQASIRAPAESSLSIITSTLQWLTAQGWGFAQGVSGLAGGLLASINRLSTVTIPHALDLAEARAGELADAARGFALAQLQELAVSLGGDILAARSEAASLVDQARSEAAGAVSAAESVVLLEVRKVEQTAGELFQQAERDAGLAVAASEQALGDLIRQARADALAAVGAAEHDLQALARASRVALVDSQSILGGDIAAAEARAQQAVGALEEQTAKSIEGILSGLPWQSLAAGVGVSEAMLQADVRTLVGLGAAEIRRMMGDVESLRARYGPEIKAAAEQLRARAK